MKRSKWKGIYTNCKFLKTKNIEKKKHKLLKITRNSQVVPQLLGSTIYIHNGKNYTELNVIKNMIGHKLGEFSFTRKNFAFKKKIKNGSKN